MVVKATNYDVTALNNGKQILSCTTNNNWKTCIWLYNEKECHFEYTFNDNSISNKWTYDEVECHPEFFDHEFLKPENYDIGNNNTDCRIKLKQVTFAGDYKCTFQSCNLEENNMCKTKVSKACPTYWATINVKVCLPRTANNLLIATIFKIFFIVYNYY